MAAVHHLLLFCLSLLGPVLGVVQRPRRGVRIAVAGASGRPDPHRQRYRPGLRAVGQVALVTA